MTTIPSLFDHPLISSRYFFPRDEHPRDVVHVDVEDAVLGCSRHITHPDAPWIVHFHGNGEVVADYESDLVPRFQAVGLNVFLAEYRGYGASTGIPSMVRMLDDVPKVLDFVGVPPENIIVYGRSVGSIYAIEAAHRAPNLRGLVIESGIASPLERILFRIRPDELGVTRDALVQAAKERLDHQHKLSHYPGRTLVLHATHDSMVDRTHAERNARWAKQSELVLYDHGDHNNVVNLNVTDIVKRVGQLGMKQS